MLGNALSRAIDQRAQCGCMKQFLFSVHIQLARFCCLEIGCLAVASSTRNMQHAARRHRQRANTAESQSRRVPDSGTSPAVSGHLLSTQSGLPPVCSIARSPSLHLSPGHAGLCFNASTPRIVDSWLPLPVQCVYVHLKYMHTYWIRFLPWVGSLGWCRSRFHFPLRNSLVRSFVHHQQNVQVHQHQHQHQHHRLLRITLQSYLTLRPIAIYTPTCQPPLSLPLILLCPRILVPQSRLQFPSFLVPCGPAL